MLCGHNWRSPWIRRQGVPTRPFFFPKNFREFPKILFLRIPEIFGNPEKIPENFREKKVDFSWNLLQKVRILEGNHFAKTQNVDFFASGGFHVSNFFTIDITIQTHSCVL